MQRASSHGALNATLTFLHVTANLFLLFGLPLLRASAGTLVLCVALGWLSALPMWCVVHEAIHRSLHASQITNDRWGRLLAVVAYGAPFAVLREGHLLHHVNNADGQFRLGARPRSPVVWYARYYLWLFSYPVATLYASNLIALLPSRVMISLAPRFAGPRLRERLLRPAVLRRLRTDAALILAVHAVSALCYAEQACALGRLLAGQCMIISFDDAVYHFKAPPDPLHGYNLYVPRVVSWLLLHFVHHGVHHHHPGMRWTQLPEAFDRSEQSYDARYLQIALQQLTPRADLVRSVVPNARRQP